MADTIVTNSPGTNDSSAGWAVAVIVLLLVIAGGFVWYRYYRAPAQAGTTNINVSVPLPGAAPAATK